MLSMRNYDYDEINMDIMQIYYFHKFPWVAKVLEPIPTAFEGKIIDVFILFYCFA